MDYPNIKSIFERFSCAKQFGVVLINSVSALALLLSATLAPYAASVQKLTFFLVGLLCILLNNCLAGAFIEEIFVKFYVLFNLIAMVDGVLQDYVRQPFVESKYIKLCFLVAFFIVLL